jgi:two-component system sensor histidine kinase YesM
MKIRTKITLFYLLLLIFSVIVSNFLYQKIYADITSRKVSQVSLQMLQSINKNVDSVIDMVNAQSKAVLSNNDIQELLTNPEKSADLNFKRKITMSLFGSKEAAPFIAGIYLFDNNGIQQAAIDESRIKGLNTDSIQEAAWYTGVINLQGAYLLSLNAGDVFRPKTESNFIALIRVINHLDTQKPIGFLVVNIPVKVFKNAFNDIGGNYDTGIIMLDENNREIVSYNDTPLHVDLSRLLPKFQGQERLSLINRFRHQDYLISYFRMERFGWKIIGIIPFSELAHELQSFNLIASIVLILISLLLFSGSLFISQLINTPIQQLLKSMKGVEKGRFEKVMIPTGRDEIGQLRDGYNLMITEIQKLIERMVDEQKVKRKAELDALQAQIKPHFLYNTFDAISALALSGKNEDVYAMIKALGSFYRTSLSKGKEIITIAEEIDLVKNYLIIQQFRYGDLFTAEYDIDPQVAELPIVKLVLQPLVENAIYHGIKPTGEKGLIQIGVKLVQNRILLTVADDGAGMNATTIERILNGGLPKEGHGFGLRGTIERLQIFYGSDDICRIESGYGSGTKITLTLPLEGGRRFG